MKRALVIFALAGAMLRTLSAQIALPIYLEDNHAGSFYWLAQQLDLEEPCTLLLFDAHSDASAIFDSDEIRTRLRRVPSVAARRELLSNWRRDGAIQCFDWIEPLMPAPLANVYWIARDGAATINEAARLDGHLEAAPRASGSLRARYRAQSLASLASGPAIEGPVVATIDLDYFSGMAPNERSAEFERIWRFIVAQRKLRAVTIAISRPYLASDEEADELLQLALRAALSLPTAQIRFEPFQTVGNDQSLRARNYRARKETVPVFTLADSSPALRALLLANRDRISVREGAEAWEKCLRAWREAAPQFRLALRGHEPSTDNIWRVAVSEPAEIEVLAQPWDARFERVEWIAEMPAFTRCNLTPLDTSFARGAPPRPRWRESLLEFSGSALPLSALSSFFDANNGCGALRIKARLTMGAWKRETAAIEIRRFRGSGFRAALTEQFGLPYLFGSGALRDGEQTGPETGWGADCANFVVAALRRQGRRVPWSNPKQLRKYLEPTHNAFTPDEVERGIILHLGSHVAALMEDLPPLGELNGDDIVAHQLEGVPELLSVNELLRTRQVSRFDLLRVPAPSADTDLLVGGDVMLGRGVGAQIETGVDPFSAIRPALKRAHIRAANLECVASPKGRPVRGKRFHLRAAPRAPAVLAAAGFDLVSMANNHAHDFGRDALRDSIRRLRTVGVATIGAIPEAPTYTIFNAGETRVAMLAINDTDALPPDRATLRQEIEKARAAADFLVALVHWGEENTTRVTERQRTLARWLIDSGVDLIAGSHPHCVQPLDFYRGRAVVYSLGNLVFDGAPRLASWNSGNLLEIGFRKGDASPSLRLTPVKLDTNGLPHLVPSPGAPTTLTRN